MNTLNIHVITIIIILNTNLLLYITGNMRGCKGNIGLKFACAMLYNSYISVGLYIPWKFNDMFALLSPNTLQALQR